MTDVSTTQDDIKSRIQHQIEYYFSRENLRRDMYLLQQKDMAGFVDLVTISRFNKLRSLTTDLQLIRQIVTASSKVELSQDQLKIREVPDGFRKVGVDLIHVNVPSQDALEVVRQFVLTRLLSSMTEKPQVMEGIQNVLTLLFKEEKDAYEAYKTLSSSPGIVVVQKEAKWKVETTKQPLELYYHSFPMFPFPPQQQQGMPYMYGGQGQFFVPYMLPYPQFQPPPQMMQPNAAQMMQPNAAQMMQQQQQQQQSPRQQHSNNGSSSRAPQKSKKKKRTKKEAKQTTVFIQPSIVSPSKKNSTNQPKYTIDDVMETHNKISTSEPPPTFDGPSSTVKRVRAKKRQSKLAISHPPAPLQKNFSMQSNGRTGKSTLQPSTSSSSRSWTDVVIRQMDTS